MSNKVYGYIRVSSKDQCEDRQVLALREHGVPEKNIFMDKLSGKDKWCYSFELPRFDEDGDEIDYTVDEEYVSGYKKSISGYDITNTFIGSSPAGEDAIDELKDSLNIADKSDYEKVKAIYDYMAANISYDYANLFVL